MIQPVEIPIARRDLKENEKITSQDMEVITVSQVYVLNGVCQSISDVEGKRVKKDCFIPAGALFYEKLVEE